MPRRNIEDCVKAFLTKDPKPCWNGPKPTERSYLGGWTTLKQRKHPVYSFLSAGWTTGSSLVWKPEDRTLYSYDSDFVIAHWLDDNDILVNSVKTTPTTNRARRTLLWRLNSIRNHQLKKHETSDWIKNLDWITFFEVPFDSLQAAGVDPKNVQLVDAQEDEWTYRCKQCGHTDEEPWAAREHQRNEHQVNLSSEQDINEFCTVTHRMGGSTFRDSKTKKQYLSGFDDGHFFLCELAQSANSLNDAFDSLMPSEVALERNFTDVLRQGDVYFVRLPKETKHKRGTLKATLTPVLPNSTHKATNAAIGPQGEPIVRGTVWHKPEGFRRRPQHPRLVLQKGWWYKPVKNTALGSWTSIGQVD